MKIFQDTSNSSSIASYSYETDTLVLEVKFKSGVSYRYFDVDNATFASLQLAPSVGNFIATQIKKFNCERITNPDVELDLSNRARWPFPTGPKPAEPNYTPDLEWTQAEEEEFFREITRQTGDL